MISGSDLRARVDEWDLREDVVEKDYVLGWVLGGIGTKPRAPRRMGLQGRHLPQEVLPRDVPVLRGP